MFLNPKLLRSCVFLSRLFDCRSFWRESGPTNSWPVTPDIECDLRHLDTRDWSRNWPWNWAGSRPGTWVGMTEWSETTAKRLGENDRFPAFSHRNNTFSVVELWPHTGECRWSWWSLLLLNHPLCLHTCTYHHSWLSGWWTKITGNQTQLLNVNTAALHVFQHKQSQRWHKHCFTKCGFPFTKTFTLISYSVQWLNNRKFVVSVTALLSGLCLSHQLQQRSSSLCSAPLKVTRKNLVMAAVWTFISSV